MSLRARLLAGLVALTAVGLAVAGLVTYTSERSFLTNQLDGQVVNSVASLQALIDTDAGLHARRPRVGTGVRARGGPLPGSGGAPGNPPVGRTGAGAGLGLGQPGAGVPPTEHTTPPPGTFGEHLNANGVRVGEPLAVGEAAVAPPRLPARPELTLDLKHPRLFTVGSTTGTLQYRVIAAPDRAVGSGFTVIAVPLTQMNASLGQLKTIEAIVIAAVLAALIALAWLLIRIGLRPLDRIAQTAGAIAAGDLSRRVQPAENRTEIGRLGLALNAMLGQIEQAFAERRASEDRLRRFLSDASHELRTPLTSIRGYAELFRLGAAAKPADTARALQRIEAEAERMGVLVEDLLALARLDEMREPLREPVALAPLLRDAAADARAMAPDRTINVATGDAELTVSGDPHQLRQVLANLVGNALTHTPDGTPLDLSLHTAAGLARLEVRDHGPGLPAGTDPAALFERFWRAERGRARGKAGAGLGLAIVAEIVAAHGGSVSAANVRGGGAAFIVELPLAAARRRRTGSKPRPPRARRTAGREPRR